ncbi:MAG: hypothetical protein A2X86_08015 [Bdellovibrionales bacterium GWA2_49_15]|nr:MAG: hypothetical protein A2X86_08015 [Bdellovibrionales bacterium GWA2_49_15]HAZ11776.1 GNAT family N-acetyltransferase [Bdellovibrionales bacterium]
MQVEQYQKVRRASLRDLPSITAIYNEAIEKTTATFDTEKKSLEDRTAWWHKHGESLPVLVYEEAGTIFGWGALGLWSDRCAYSGTVENSIYVLEKYRGRGVGDALLSELIDLAREQGLHTIIARITEGNEASIRLHEKYAFLPIGIMREVGRKFGKLLDVHLMQLIL